MSKKDYHKENNNNALSDREVKDLQKDEVNGKRRKKRKDKDYEKKYGEREDSWN
jgi:hypothetical protein